MILIRHRSGEVSRDRRKPAPIRQPSDYLEGQDLEHLTKIEREHCNIPLTSTVEDKPSNCRKRYIRKIGDFYSVYTTSLGWL
jgi:hypothetical protein